MPTIYCYPVKLTIADLIRAKTHMLTDSVQPYNKPIIDLACSVDCTVKYQTFASFRMDQVDRVG